MAYFYDDDLYELAEKADFISKAAVKNTALPFAVRKAMIENASSEFLCELQKSEWWDEEARQEAFSIWSEKLERLAASAIIGPLF